MPEAFIATSIVKEALDELEKLWDPALSGAQSSSQPQPQQRMAFDLYLVPLTSNPATATSLPYLLKHFPGVREAMITSVIQHEFPPSDLYKFDSRYQDEGEKNTLKLPSGITYEVPNINSSLKEYKTLSSIIGPLSTYFSILIAHYQFAGNAALLAVQLSSNPAGVAWFNFFNAFGDSVTAYSHPPVLDTVKSKRASGNLHMQNQLRKSLSMGSRVLDTSHITHDMPVLDAIITPIAELLSPIFSSLSTAAASLSSMPLFWIPEPFSNQFCTESQKPRVHMPASPFRVGINGPSYF
ncbi:hypothetical protein EV421DRAFT_2018748 [Armillaria borealis]|uniref:Uncharacterized protein n=1 Tax=Armillaria borealis TaxID=47425 RepID=A0AA39MS45_9AGAR|nr:hypothetical protein EV421DRAFT_2018748 [Armillaria borealis]